MIKMVMFSSQSYDRTYFNRAAEGKPLEIKYFEAALNEETASLASGHQVVCAFVNDKLNLEVIQQLQLGGARLIAMRCAGFNNVDLDACRQQGVSVVRVPEYSPYAVAEHTFGLVLTLNRKIHKAFNRVREGNFSLDGLMGFDLHGKSMGVIGGGKIGACVGRIAHGFGMKVRFVDPYPDESLKSFGEFTSLETLLQESDIVSLHCPLLESNYHLLDAESIATMKRGSMLVNTSRGGLVDSAAVIGALKSGHLGALAIDVYEDEVGMFFSDRSSSLMLDDVFARLTTFPNVLITGHQAFFTHEALTQIATTTVDNALALGSDQPLRFEVTVDS